MRVGKYVALVTGANRGIGFQVARQLAEKGCRAVLTARDPRKGIASVEELRTDNLDVEFVQLDVCKPQSVRRAVTRILDAYGHIDIVVNNAAVNLDSVPLSEISLDIVLNTFETNVCGALHLIQTVLPSMMKHRYGRIVNVSTVWGSLTEMAKLNSEHATIEAPAYRISKTALNMVTLLFARELAGTNI